MLRAIAKVAGLLMSTALVISVGCAPASIECDVQSEACRNDTFQSVAEFLDAPDAKQPPVRILSEDEFSEDLLNDPGLTGDEDTSRWLQMLGFLQRNGARDHHRRAHQLHRRRALRPRHRVDHDRRSAGSLVRGAREAVHHGDSASEVRPRCGGA